jgi:hypothetical protein
LCSDTVGRFSVKKIVAVAAIFAAVPTIIIKITSVIEIAIQIVIAIDIAIAIAIAIVNKIVITIVIEVFIKIAIVIETSSVNASYKINNLSKSVVNDSKTPNLRQRKPIILHKN